MSQRNKIQRLLRKALWQLVYPCQLRAAAYRQLQRMQDRRMITAADQ